MTELEELKIKLASLMEEYDAEIVKDYGTHPVHGYGEWLYLCCGLDEEELYHVINEFTL